MAVRLLVLVTCVLPACVLPTGASADCHGFFNQSEQGYKLEGNKLEPTGPTIAAGTEFEFNGITQVKNRAFLTRSRSDVIYDAANVELTSGCDLPDRPPPQAR